jgi:hypothetical protein
MTDSTPENRAVQRTKLERVCEEYDLPNLGDELEDRWTRPTEERDSLRELADIVNRRVLEAAMSSSDLELVDGMVANYYRLLTDDDVSRGDKVEVETLLKQNGVDVESVLADFVSHQTVHNYLTEEREASFTIPETDPQETDLQSIARLRNRIEGVVDDKVGRRRDAGDIQIESYEVLVNVSIICDRCGRESSIETLLTQGGCNCLVKE